MTHPRTIRLLSLAAAGALLLTGCGDDGGDTATEGAGGSGSVSFASPRDGETVSSPVTVEMVAEGVTVEPAGEVSEGTGHFHVMIDTDCLPAGETIPNDDRHRHFGDGSTTAELELEPGEHTLCLQLADGAHTALDLTDEVTITVE